MQFYCRAAVELSPHNRAFHLKIWNIRAVTFETKRDTTNASAYQPASAPAATPVTAVGFCDVFLFSHLVVNFVLSRLGRERQKWRSKEPERAKNIYWKYLSYFANITFLYLLIFKEWRDNGSFITIISHSGITCLVLSGLRVRAGKNPYSTLTEQNGIIQQQEPPFFQRINQFNSYRL